MLLLVRPGSGTTRRCETRSLALLQRLRPPWCSRRGPQSSRLSMVNDGVSARPRFAELSGPKLVAARAQWHRRPTNFGPPISHYKTPPCARLAPVRSANSKPRTPPAVGLQVRCPVRAWSTLARPERQRRQRAHVPHGRRELSGRPAPLRRQLRHRPSTWRRLDRRTKPEPSWADRA